MKRRVFLGPVILCFMVIGLIGADYGQVAYAKAHVSKSTKSVAAKEVTSEKKKASKKDHTTLESKKQASHKGKKKAKADLASASGHKHAKGKAGAKSKSKKISIAKKGSKAKKNVLAKKNSHTKKSSFAKKNSRIKKNALAKNKKGKKTKSRKVARVRAARQKQLATHIRPISDYQLPSPKPSDLWLAKESPDKYKEISGDVQSEGVALRVLELAYSCLGAPYRPGGTTPDGFDCSGFVKYVFKENGINLGRSSKEQARQGKSVQFSDLKPGDLIFFKMQSRRKSGSDIDHVGLYVGDGQFIHASSNRRSREIKVDELGKEHYFSKIVETRRVLDEQKVSSSLPY